MQLLSSSLNPEAEESRLMQDSTLPVSNKERLDLTKESHLKSKSQFWTRNPPLLVQREVQRSPPLKASLNPTQQ